MKTYRHMESALIHGGIYGDKSTGAVNTPIYQTSTFEQEALGKHRGWEYSRTGNPTRAALEALIAELEGGGRGFAFASGMAAITAVLHLFKSGDVILLPTNVYGGTFRVIDKIMKPFGLQARIVDTTDPQALEAAMTPEVRAVLLETPANPLLTITDIRAVAQLTKKNNLLFVVDNTFMTPYLQRPIALGADIVLHSATKYLGGHSDLIAGLVVVEDSSLAERLHFIQNATGGILQPFDSYLLIRSIKTLGIRMDAHVRNAEQIADLLVREDGVRHVFYPGLPGEKGYETNRAQAKNGGAMISFELAERYDYRKFLSSLNLVALAESLGGVESLICHPASMTHASIPKEIREQVGIHDGLLRLSVGLEHIEDLLADLRQAIAEARM